MDCGNGYCCSNAYPVCCSNGQCATSASGCGGGGSSPPPSTGGDHTICESTYVEGCTDLKACANAAGAYYDADGKIFRCNAYSCESAAEDAVEYCESLKGCSIGGAGTSNMTGAALVLTILGLLHRRRGAAGSKVARRGGLLAMLGLFTACGVTDPAPHAQLETAVRIPAALKNGLDGASVAQDAQRQPGVEVLRALPTKEASQKTVATPTPSALPGEAR
ncbi:hypothetical protein DAT35_33170 [Vitiosangium sp. GDMCC 1.1324]|nr:hypothetical protein DAT35_33170 [Vitiosangium sp. GDMCC 1.1324]